MSEPRIIALVPARGGSSRVPRKNIKPLAGHPLIAYTLAAAKQSGIFCGIFVSTEDEEIGRTALSYGDVCWIKRPPEMATSQSPDIDWIRHALEYETSCALPFDYFAILRPTSPFRSAEMIRDAHYWWCQRAKDFDSLRAMEIAVNHPAKCWEIDESGYAHPVKTYGLKSPPAHSRATQTLPTVLAQNASLEIAHVSTVLEKGSISGERIMPYLTLGYQGFDLNSTEDWILAEALLERGMATLPEVG